MIDSRGQQVQRKGGRVCQKKQPGKTMLCQDVTSPAVAGKYLVEAISVRQSQYTACQTRLDLYSKRLNERGHMLELKERANNTADDENRDVLADWLYTWHISTSHRTEDLIFRDRVVPEVILACCIFIDSMKRDDYKDEEDRTWITDEMAHNIFQTLDIRQRDFYVAQHPVVSFSLRDTGISRTAVWVAVMPPMAGHGKNLKDQFST